MGKEGAREAVPPCFTEWIGRELLRVAARHNADLNHGEDTKQ
jgi:hypothetical protein